MKYLDLRLSPPDWMLHPMQAFIRDTDVVAYEELLTWSVRPDEHVQDALYYVEADLSQYKQAVNRLDTTIDTHIARIDERSAHVWVSENILPQTRPLVAAFAERHLVVVPPIRFDQDAAMEMTLVGPSEDIQLLLEELPSEVAVSINEIGTFDQRGGTLVGALTDRQRTALTTALDLGYFEVPREARLADVAEALDCTESTASVLLRRAQRDMYTRLLNRYGGTV